MWNPNGDLAKYVQFQKDVADASDTPLFDQAIKNVKEEKYVVKS